MSEGRPDFNGSNYDDAFVGDLVNFVASNKFQSMFENYFLSHALFFSDDEEHKLEYMDYYMEFHKLFEEQLEDFCQEKGMDQSEFMARCSEASTEDPKAKHYISILLSSVEYKTFVQLMKIMRPVAERRKAMEAAMAASSLEEHEVSADDNLPEFESDGQSADAKAESKADDPNRFEGSPAKGELEEADEKGSKNVSQEDSGDSKGEPREAADTKVADDAGAKEGGDKASDEK